MASGYLHLRIVVTELPNGEVLGVVINAESEELLSVQIKRPDHSCHGCRRVLEADDMAFGIDGELYCELCGGARLRGAV